MWRNVTFTFSIPIISFQRSIIAFNTRGLRNLTKGKGVFSSLEQFETDFCFLQECHSTKDDCNFWRRQWGLDLGVDRLSAWPIIAPILSILPIIDIGHFKNRFADNFFFFNANKHTIYR